MGIALGLTCACARVVSQHHMSAQGSLRRPDRATLDGAHLAGAQLSQTDAELADLDAAGLNSANITKAHRRRARGAGTVVHRANFTAEDLTDGSGVDLAHATLTGADHVRGCPRRVHEGLGPIGAP